MAHRQNRNQLTFMAIEHHVSGVAKRYEPFSELRGHILNWSANLGMLGKCFYALLYDASGTSRRLPALGRQEIMQARHVPQRGWCPGQAWHGSVMYEGLAVAQVCPPQVFPAMHPLRRLSHVNRLPDIQPRRPLRLVAAAHTAPRARHIVQLLRTSASARNGGAPAQAVADGP
jgi:hypothetical protein